MGRFVEIFVRTVSSEKLLRSMVLSTTLDKQRGRTHCTRNTQKECVRCLSSFSSNILYLCFILEMSYRAIGAAICFPRDLFANKQAKRATRSIEQKENSHNRINRAEKRPRRATKVPSSDRSEV